MQKFNRYRGTTWRVAAALLLFMACGSVPHVHAQTSNPIVPPQTQPVAAPAALPGVRLMPAFHRLSFDRPVFITHAGDGSGRLFVVEQHGRIMMLDSNSVDAQASVFLDIRSATRMPHNEEGLLSLVFDPKFAENSRLYVYYTVSNPKRNRIARFSVSKENPNAVDRASEEIILEVEQPYGNHNGSTLLFGPDGFLYASFGDGGWADDPLNSGQDLSTLLGTIIRIDVNSKTQGKNYAIPADNPFVNSDAGARPEIWAYGLRNVWRMSFDSATGDLWAADVGQNDWEEIDLITKGGNYGWNIREGKHDFPRRRHPTDPQVVSQLIDPVVEYAHRQGISVTGGYVYRGKRFADLVGVYVYADYASGRIWGLRYENGSVVRNQQIGGPPSGERRYITSFGEDADGELLVCAFDRMDGTTGRIYRMLSE